MKISSDAPPASSIQSVMKPVKTKGVPVVVYESTLALEFFSSEAARVLEVFKTGCNVIVDNSWIDWLADAAGMAHTGDLFKRS